MVEPDFKFRSGKYEGMTYEWVCKNNPSYIEWVKENQPNMLLEKVTTVINIKETKHEFGKLKFNTNFENEGPAPNSIPYLNKMKELDNE